MEGDEVLLTEQLEDQKKKTEFYRKSLKEKEVSYLPIVSFQEEKRKRREEKKANRKLTKETIERLQEEIRQTKESQQNLLLMDDKEMASNIQKLEKEKAQLEANFKTTRAKAKVRIQDLLNQNAKLNETVKEMEKKLEERESSAQDSTQDSSQGASAPKPAEEDASFLALKQQIETLESEKASLEQERISMNEMIENLSEKIRDKEELLLNQSKALKQLEEGSKKQQQELEQQIIRLSEYQSQTNASGHFLRSSFSIYLSIILLLFLQRRTISKKLML